MTYTLDSKVSDILRKPGIKVIIEKYVGTIDSGKLQMISGMTLRQVVGFLNWPDNKVEILLQDLNK